MSGDNNKNVSASAAAVKSDDKPKMSVTRRHTEDADDLARLIEEVRDYPESRAKSLIVTQLEQALLLLDAYECDKFDAQNKFLALSKFGTNVHRARPP